MATKKKTTRKRKKKTTAKKREPVTLEPVETVPYPRLGDSQDFKQLAHDQILGKEGIQEETVSDAGRPMGPPTMIQEPVSMEMLTAMWQRPFDMWALVANNKHMAITPEEAHELAKPSKILCDLYMPTVDPKALAMYTLGLTLLTIVGSRYMLLRKIQQDTGKAPGPAANVPSGASVKTTVDTSGYSPQVI